MSYIWRWVIFSQYYSVVCHKPVRITAIFVYTDSHCNDNTVVMPFYLYNDEMASLYWDGFLESVVQIIYTIWLRWIIFRYWGYALIQETHHRFHHWTPELLIWLRWQQCELLFIITLQCDILALVWLVGPAKSTFWTCQCNFSAPRLYPASGTLPNELKIYIELD